MVMMIGSSMGAFVPDTSIALRRTRKPIGGGNEGNIMNAAIAKAIAETGANSVKQMGAVVKAAKSALEGKVVDGKALSDLVRARLS